MPIKSAIALGKNLLMKADNGGGKSSGTGGDIGGRSDGNKDNGGRINGGVGSGSSGGGGGSRSSGIGGGGKQHNHQQVLMISPHCVSCLCL